MNINLNNYEQWLLLYVDNELSAAERSSVEEFLGQYPYLQQELEALQQATLPIENILFDIKGSLLKPAVSEETREKMLLQLDNELPATEKAALLKNIATDKNLGTEWASLQKTQLDKAEIIPFPDKQSLYKKEKSRLISMVFIRWTAAAVLVGLGFWLATNFSRNSGNDQPGFASNNNDSSVPVTKPTHDKIAVADPSATNVNKPGERKDNKKGSENIYVKNNDVAVTNDDVDRTTTKQVEVIKKEAVESVPKRNINDVAATHENKKTIQPNDVNIVPPNNTVLPSLNDIAALPNKKTNNSIDLNDQVTSPKKEIIDFEKNTTRNAYAQTAAYTFDQNNNSVLLMEEEDITRSKAGIFLKKVKRNIERRANIKPGKSLKIAGFELAVK